MRGKKNGMFCFFNGKPSQSIRTTHTMNKITDWYGSTGLTMGIAADHGGFELKSKLIPFLEGKGLTVRDFGPTVYDAGDD